MGAVCGLFQLDGRPVRREEITAQMDALAHRGSGGSAIWSCGAVGLGQASGAGDAARGATQPLIHDAGRLVIVADARIDNAGELASYLGVAPSDAGDAAIILRAYERWGARCPEHLIGDFAFAIWDRGRNAVYCARDPMGVKPLYYHHSARIFAFASEIKALFAIPGIRREVDDRAVARYIACLQDDRERTMYRGIARLPAAHSLRVGRDGFARTAYWRADAAGAVRFASDADYVEAFREVFTEAVRARIGGGARVGATLSGGLDSSSVTCMARRLAPASVLPTFSLVFPSLPERELAVIDERSFIESVLRTPGLDPHLVRGDLVSPLTDRARMRWHLDEPHIAPNLYLHCALYGAARDSGVRVLLDGFDGDAAISHGFGRLNSLLASEDWSSFEQEARAFAGHRGKAADSVLPHFGYPFVRSLARRGRADRWLRMSRELARRFSVSRRELAVSHGIAPVRDAAHRWLRPPVASSNVAAMLRAGHASVIDEELRAMEEISRAMSIADERTMHLDTITQPLYQLTLEIADKAAHAFGIEPRYPFFDRRLIEFCVGLPEEQKFGRGWPRFLFRRAMEGILPPDVQWRATKGNLAPNFDRQFRAHDRAAVESGCGRLAGHVDQASLETTARRYFSGTSWGDPDGLLLFRTTLLGDWLAAVAADTSGRRPAIAPALNGITTPVQRQAVGCLTT